MCRLLRGRLILAPRLTPHMFGLQAEKIKSHRGLKLSEAQDVFVGCYKTLRAGVRARMTDGQLEEDLKDLRCPQPVIEDFQAAVRQVLEVQATGVKCGNRVAITCAPWQYHSSRAAFGRRYPLTTGCS